MVCSLMSLILIVRQLFFKSCLYLFFSQLLFGFRVARFWMSWLDDVAFARLQAANVLYHSQLFFSYCLFRNLVEKIDMFSVLTTILADFAHALSESAVLNVVEHAALMDIFDRLST